MNSKFSEENNFLPILAIETSGDLCSAAVLSSQSEFAEVSIQKKHVHSEKLLDVIDKLLSLTNLSLENIGALAVSMGPGSFTGLRIGMSAAKGLAFGTGKPLVPVPTFYAAAMQIAAHISSNQKFYVVMNASVEEVYLACFESGDKDIITITEPMLFLKSELEKRIEHDIPVFGNFKIKKSQHYPFSAPRGEYIAKWAFFFGKDLLTSQYDYLEPIYLKDFIPKV